MLTQKTKYVAQVISLTVLSYCCSVSTSSASPKYQLIQPVALEATPIKLKENTQSRKRQFLEKLVNLHGEAFLNALLDLNDYVNKSYLYKADPDLIVKIYSSQNIVTVVKALESEFRKYSFGVTDKNKLIAYQTFLGYYGDARHYYSNTKEWGSKIRIPALSKTTLTNIKTVYTNYFAIPNIIDKVVNNQDDAEVAISAVDSIRYLGMTNLYLQDITKFIPPLLRVEASTKNFSAANLLFIIPRNIRYVDKDQYGDWKSAIINKNVLDKLKLIIDSYSRTVHPTERLSRAAEEAAIVIGHHLSKYYDNPTIRNAMFPIGKDIMNRYHSNPKNVAYLAVGIDLVYYKQCKVMHLCNDWKQRAISTIFKFKKTCPKTGSISDQVTIRAENLTPSEFTTACKEINEAYARTFNKIGTNVPLRGNNKLLITVFSNSADNMIYGNLLFDITSGSGVFYASRDNAPSRIYTFKLHNNLIMNLRHEVTHYLESRYIVADYTDYSSRESLTWFIEGFAQYIQYLNSNEQAIAIGKKNKYLATAIISEVDDPDYVYHGGYLLSRYFFDRQPNEMKRVLQALRKVNAISLAIARIKTFTTIHDHAFQNWVLYDVSSQENPNLEECINGACDPNQQRLNLNVTKMRVSTVNNRIRYFHVNVPEWLNDVIVKTFSGEGDVDIYAKYNSWPTKKLYDARIIQPGTTHDLLIHMPVAQGGSNLYLALVPGQSGFKDISLEAVLENKNLEHDTCKVDHSNLFNRVPKTGVFSMQNPKHYAIWVPVGSKDVLLKTFGGKGNVDIYARYGTWPSRRIYDARTRQLGTNHELRVYIPGIKQFKTGDYLYVSLYPQGSFEDVNLEAILEPNQCTSIACNPGYMQMTNAVAKKGISSTQSRRHYSMWVPYGFRNIQIDTSGGRGDLEVYVGYGYWPTRARYDAKSISSGTYHQIEVPISDNPIYEQGGSIYITLYPKKGGFKDVSLEGILGLCPYDKGER
jgi:hypothetical protein